MVVLPAPEGPTSATSCPGSATKVMSDSTVFSGVCIGHGNGFERCERDFRRRGITKRDSIERNPSRAGRDRDGVGLILDHRLQIEHLEYAFERDERGHQTYLDIRKPSQGAVKPNQVRDESHDCTDVKFVLDCEHAAPAVGECGGENGHEPKRGKE